MVVEKWHSKITKIVLFIVSVKDKMRFSPYIILYEFLLIGFILIKRSNKKVNTQIEDIKQLMKTKKKLNISISILAFTTNAVNTDNTIEIMIIVDATVFRQLQNDFLLKTFFFG